MLASQTNRVFAVEPSEKELPFAATFGALWSHALDPGDHGTSATVTGTNGDDFIHRSGDGLHVPAHYHDIPQATAGSDTIDGGKGDDIIYADDGGDTVHGGSGNDTIYGGDGIDSLNGDSGNDTIHAGSSETVHGGGGKDKIIGGNYLFGEGGDDTLTDNDPFAHAKLVGGPGNDRLIGDGSTEAYYANETAGVTIDLRITKAQNTGAAGRDTLKGISEVSGSNYNDVLTGNNAANTLYGGYGKDTLNGSGGNDTLAGYAGDDTLWGGKGVDRLIGSSDKDRFVFKSTNETGIGATHRDVIADFHHTEHDIIDVHKIDADTTHGGNQDFTLVHKFTHHPGQLIQVTQAGNTIVKGDVNGDGHADFEIELTGLITLVKSDFHF